MKMNMLLENNTTQIEQAKQKIAGFAAGKESGIDLADLNLTTLEGLGIPERINAEFDCRSNPLKTLVGGPKYVTNSYIADDCDIAGFEGCPEEVIGFLSLDSTKITSLVGISDYVKKVDGNIFFYCDPITKGGIEVLLIEQCKSVFGGERIYGTDCKAFRIISEYLKNHYDPASLVYDCQQELIANGLEEFAEL